MPEAQSAGVMHPGALHAIGHLLWFTPVHRALVRAAGVQRGERVIDVGAGTGALSGRLVRAGAEVICLEPDPASLSAARSRLRGRDVEFVEANAEKIPLPDASVDAALASLTAHHWADREAAFGELARVIRPGGRLVMAEFRPTGGLVRALRRVARSTHGDPPPLSAWQVELGKAGFSDIVAAPARWAGALALFIRATRAGR